VICFLIVYQFLFQIDFYSKTMHWAFFIVILFFIKYLFYLHVSARIFFQSFILKLLFITKQEKNSLKKTLYFAVKVVLIITTFYFIIYLKFYES